MKILVVSRYCAPPSFHGSAQHVQTFAKALVEDGHEVRVISGEESAGTVSVDGYTIEKVLLRTPRRGLYRIFDGRLPDMAVRDYAAHVLDTWRPDVLHVGVFMRMGEFALEAAARQIPVVMMVHDYSCLCLKKYLQHGGGAVCSGPECRKCLNCLGQSIGPKLRLASKFASLPGAEVILGRQRILNYQLGQAVTEAFNYMERLRNSVDRFVVQTPLAAEVLASCGVSLGRCRLVQQYIGEEKMISYPKDFGKPGVDRPVRLGYVGRWSPEKGTEVLRDACVGLVGGSLELRLIAKDASLESVGKLFGTGLVRDGRIMLYNDLAGAALASAIAQLDLIVIPSVCHDNSPRVLLEAIAQGVPVIVSDSVGNRHLVLDGISGRIFPSGDATALARILREVIARPETIDNWCEHLPKLPNRQEWYQLLMHIHQELLAD